MDSGKISICFHFRYTDKTKSECCLQQSYKSSLVSQIEILASRNGNCLNPWFRMFYIATNISKLVSSILIVCVERGRGYVNEPCYVYDRHVRDMASKLLSARARARAYACVCLFVYVVLSYFQEFSTISRC